jgi:hypothetical protein
MRFKMQSFGIVGDTLGRGQPSRKSKVLKPVCTMKSPHFNRIVLDLYAFRPDFEMTEFLVCLGIQLVSEAYVLV